MVCKQCGGTDHQRASSTKCTNHVPKQKRRFVDVSATSTLYAVKSGFTKFCTDVALRDKIERDVLEVSDLAVEASLYVLISTTHDFYKHLLRRFLRPHAYTTFTRQTSKERSDCVGRKIFPITKRISTRTTFLSNFSHTKCNRTTRNNNNEKLRSRPSVRSSL